MRVIIAVWLGGAAGTAVRYEVALAIHQTPGRFPWATFLVNVAGSFILGALLVLILERWPPTRYARPLGGIGVCGGLTTFSSWVVEVALLVEDGVVGTAALYLGATLVVGLGAVYLGTAVGRLWPS